MTMSRMAVVPALLAVLFAGGCRRPHPVVHPQITLASPAFADGQTIPVEFTCDGADRSPPLKWAGVPAAARSLAVLVDDPDAIGGRFVHWGVYDIPPETVGFDPGIGGSQAAGGFSQTRNGFGTSGYRGPCPPREGPPHRYRIRLLALDVPHLALAGDADGAALEQAAQDHVIASTMMLVRYR